MRVLSENHKQLGNSRMGIVLAVMVRDTGDGLVDELATHYETAMIQHPKAEVSELRKAARDGLDAFLTASEAVGKTSPAFGDTYGEVFKRTLADAAERLRAKLELAMNSVILPAKVTWQKRLKDERPIVYDVIVGLIVTLILGAIAGPLILKLFHIIP